MQYQTPAIFINRVCNSVKNSLGQYNVWSTSANNCNVIIGHFWTKCFLVKTSEVDKKGPFSMALIYMTAGQGACHPRHNNTKSTSLLCLNIPPRSVGTFFLRKNVDICFFLGSNIPPHSVGTFLEEKPWHLFFMGSRPQKFMFSHLASPPPHGSGFTPGRLIKMASVEP